MRKQRHWSPDEDDVLFQLQDEGELYFKEIGERLGRSRDAVASRWKWLHVTAEERERRRLREADRRRRKGVPIRGTGEYTRPELIRAYPDHVFADRHARETAPRTLTAIICGDPAPGWSALDRRQHEATA